MTPATPQTPKSIRKQIGPAFQLFFLLARGTPDDWNGETPVYVAGGKIFSDAELAQRLEASLDQIANWRLRLRFAGLIGWLVAPRQGRVFWVSAVNRLLGANDETKPLEHKPSQETDAAKAEALNTMPAVSRLLQ